VKRKGSLPFSQQPAICSYPELDQSSAGRLSCSVRTHFSIVLLLTSSFSKNYFFFSFLLQKPVYTFLFPHACYLLHLSHFSLYDHPNNIRWVLQIMTLLITQFSPFLCHFLPLRPKQFKFLPAYRVLPDKINKLKINKARFPIQRISSKHY
jgi:hypothetical protein